MEMKDLTSVVLVLVLVGLIVGVGVLVLDQFGQSVRQINTVVAEDVTLTTNAGTLTNVPVITFTRFGNSTVNLTTGTDVNVTLASGAIVTNGALVDGTYQAYYTYYYNTSATTVLNSGVSAVSGIATNWMALIVTIIVLALILGFVVTSFGNKMR